MQLMTQEACEKHQMSTYRESRSTYRKTALFVSLFFGVTLFYFYSRKSTAPEVLSNKKLPEKLTSNDLDLPDTPEIETVVQSPPESSEKMDWNTVDFKELALPSEVEGRLERVEIETGTKDIQNIQMFFREARIPEGVAPSGQCLLLLHGMAFKSETWMKDVKTLQTMASLGHRAVAIDLPGFGESPKAYVEDKASFLVEVIEKFALNHPVVISPSMSGGWSLPLLTKRPELLGGYVPVAPVDTESVTQDTYKSLQVPTLIVYGELDKGLGAVSYRNLKNIPTSKAYELPNARHPAYLDQKEEWHQLLHNFMLKIKRST